MTLQTNRKSVMLRKRAERRKGVVPGTRCRCGATEGVWVVQIGAGTFKYGPKIELCEGCLPKRGTANRFRFVREGEA